MPVVVIDAETTGLGHHSKPPRPDAVVQVGMAYRANGRVRRWSTYCNPGAQYFAGGRADEALRVNGISLETIMSSPSVGEAAESLGRQLRNVRPLADAIEFRSFNKSFDLPFLSGDPWNLEQCTWGDCIMLDAQKHLRWYKWPKLSEAAEALGIEWPDGPAHDAAVDAHAALLVHEKVCGRV
ncbi:hypothetical protein HZC09_01160 [Candidatus Micrarchaeota archaeon]|nr:hypothetical protein [Candidatus Micrarchaeota archaeon]